MFPESALLPISALQHLLFCERQCALIHVEQVWAENYLTIQGQHLHKKAHDGPHETRHGVRVARGLKLRSLRLGLIGQADVVEIEMSGTKAGQSSGAGRPDKSMRVTPIEYKRGRPKKDDSDRVQLCAQALCLEEMLQVGIPRGEIFYGKKRRRSAVEFDTALRELTELTVRRLHELIASGQTPIARFEPKCESCSLFELCMPGVTGLRRSAARVLDKFLAANLSGDGPTTDDQAISDFAMP
jgi:CRISPR-associated exonuclease Cas4